MTYTICSDSVLCLFQSIHENLALFDNQEKLNLLAFSLNNVTYIQGRESIIGKGKGKRIWKNVKVNSYLGRC